MRARRAGGGIGIPFRAAVFLSSEGRKMEVYINEKVFKSNEIL